MQRLSGAEFKALRQALLSAYRSRGALKIVVRDVLGIWLNDFAPEGCSLEETVAELLEWVESKGKLEALLRGLREEEAQNSELRALCDRLLGGGVASGDGLGAVPLTAVGEVTVTVDREGKIIARKQIAVRYFTEWIGDVGLEMVPIAGGTYLRGSPEGEEGRTSTEGPQFQVSVPEFWMGRYPVTQAQWQVVAQLPKVERDLTVDPSYFKGARRPVECISWDDAREFCARLSCATGNAYRLPSEAEWEYACRSGTTTPFTFGHVLSAELANYDCQCNETTDVGRFPPNAWRLHDLHGNVWEWCEDSWKNSYQGVPIDGKSYFDNRTYARLLRGGSRSLYPRFCRSACRNSNARADRDSYVGFRVACDVPRPL